MYLRKGLTKNQVLLRWKCLIINKISINMSLCMKIRKVYRKLMIIKIIFTIFIGFAGGLSVGAGYVAFLTVLGIIPRLTQLTKTMKMIQLYEWAVVIGAVIGTLAILQEPHFHLTRLILILFGLAGGIFVGMMT